MKNLLLVGCLAALFSLPALAADRKALRLAREVVQLTQSDAIIERLGAESERRCFAAFAELSPKDRAAGAKVARDVGASTVKKMRALREAMPAVYAEVFTVKELRAMKAFYGSPAGRAWLERQPLLAHEVRRLTEEILQGRNGREMSAN